MKNVIYIKDKKYPSLLKKIGKDAPKQLYYKGNWDDDIFENCLAVVGSRRMTVYGKRVVGQIVTPLSGAGITIVSGFMYGIDAQSHRAALKAGGRTIAVMPCGINLVHPEYQQDLYNEILSNKGLVISEYEGDMLPTNWTYPRRNRIVAGLSRATLVVEAGEGSGSLITANFTKRFGRKLFVVPGPITSNNSKGITRLLKESATPVSSAKDILDFYRVRQSFSEGGSDKKDVKGIEGKILEQLQREPLEIDILSRILGISPASLGTTLSLMQLKGLIQFEGNKYYIC